MFRIYDIDGNGLIDKKELKTIIDSIYKLLSDGKDSSVKAKDHASEIFKRLNIDKNKYITLDEFIDSCMKDQNLLKLLAPSA